MCVSLEAKPSLFSPNCCADCSNNVNLSCHDKPILSHHNPQEKILYFQAGHSPNDIVDHLNKNSCHDFTMCNDGYGKNKNSRRLICRCGRLARTSKGTTKMSATQLPTSHVRNAPSLSLLIEMFT
jgi:hypothetical protein